MCAPISAVSSAESLQQWASQLATPTAAPNVPVWGWLSPTAPQGSGRTHIPVNRLRPLAEWVTQEPALQGGGEFWLLTMYQGHVLAVVVADASGVWSARREQFQPWGWS